MLAGAQVLDALRLWYFNVVWRKRSIRQAIPASASWTNKKASGVDAFPNNAGHGENRSVDRVFQQQTVNTSFTRTRN